jgi:hypothetical protein
VFSWQIALALNRPPEAADRAVEVVVADAARGLAEPFVGVDSALRVTLGAGWLTEIGGGRLTR